MIDDDVGEFELVHILPIITINLKQMLHFRESIWQVLIVDYKQYPIPSIKVHRPYQSMQHKTNWVQFIY